MASDDRAILVGIARYRDSDAFPTLDGPLNDIERVRDWLTDPQGAAVPGDNVVTLMTPQALLALPGTGWPENTEWSPNASSFSQAFNKIAFDTKGEPLRRKSRLYLYFSGHGFSLSEDGYPSAALFSADNYGSVHSNLAGSVYAAAIKRAGLFSEVVLIMDCCRDVFGNFTYNPPSFNRVENSAAESTKVYALYAAPRRGKSQERELPNSNGKVVGLMTDAFLRALEDAPSDVAGCVAGQVLTRVMTYNWANWYPVSPLPPAPRSVPPDQGDIYFKSRRTLNAVSFTSATPLLPDSTLYLRSDLWNAVATVKASSLIWRDTAYSWEQEIALSQSAEGGQQFTLILAPGNHALSAGTTVRTFDPGVDNAIAL
jgi:hypothetical protein